MIPYIVFCLCMGCFSLLLSLGIVLWLPDVYNWRVNYVNSIKRLCLAHETTTLAFVFLSIMRAIKLQKQLLIRILHIIPEE